jgi:hypothetical protein
MLDIFGRDNYNKAEFFVRSSENGLSAVSEDFFILGGFWLR